MTSPLDPDSIVALKEALAAGRKAKSLERKKKTLKTARQTCWNGEGTIRRGRPNMMGEGLGVGTMGLVVSKATRTYGPGEIEAEFGEPTEEEIAAKKAAAVEKARRTRARNKARKEALKAKEEAGELLRGFRIFLARYPYGDWEERAKVFGGIPEGVSHHHSPFGDLLMVPVIEREEGKEIGLFETPFKDPRGRLFWVSQTYREQVEMVFGRVTWDKPLTERQAREFGARF